MSKSKYYYKYLEMFEPGDNFNWRLPKLHTSPSNSGPIIWLTGCIHGDEVGGIVIIQEVFKWLAKNSIKKGQILAFPLINGGGFMRGSRYINAGQEDLNRCFPGKIDGTMGERIAHRIFNEITKTKPDLVIDLHNDWIRSIPYLVLDSNVQIPKDSVETPQNQTLATSLKYSTETGFLIIGEDPGIPYAHNTLSGSMIDKNIPSFTLEVGGAYILDEVNIKRGLKAILNLLSALEMIDPVPNDIPKYPYPYEIENQTLTYYSKPIPKNSGIIRFLTSPGNLIKKGEKLAIIFDALGRKKEVLSSDVDGIVLGFTDFALVQPGNEIIAIGAL